MVLEMFCLCAVARQDGQRFSSYSFYEFVTIFVFKTLNFHENWIFWKILKKIYHILPPPLEIDFSTILAISSTGLTYPIQQDMMHIKINICDC